MAYNESYDSFLKRFCGNLKKALTDAGLTQRKQLLTGLDPRYISRIKSGQGNPTLQTIWKLGKAAGVDPETLFKKTKR
jgi:transcriptional regulator with XRE-family HTH domain